MANTKKMAAKQRKWEGYQNTKKESNAETMANTEKKESTQVRQDSN